MPKRTRGKDISRIFAEGTLIDEAMAKAVYDALLRHKKLGNTVAAWRDGRVVLIPPDQIVLPELPKRRGGRRRRR